MTTTTCGRFPGDSRAAAEAYLVKGLAPIPMPPRTKKPDYGDWQHLRLTAETLDQHFPPQQARNVGILNGEPSANHLDVDLDCPEALRAGPLLLPATGWVFGHKSAPWSHWIYKTDVSLDSAQEAYEDLDGKKVVELRGTGGLTVYPPSTHKETGERITWDKFTDPADVALSDLQRVVRALAAAALLAQHWPAKGSRDAAAMALSGGLTRAGWDEEQVSQFCRAVAVAAGDEEAKMRAGKAKPAARKQEDGKKTTGWPSLEKLMGTDGPEVVRRVRDWLGLSVAAEVAEVTPEPLPWPDPPAEEAFHGLAGRVVRAIEPASEADPAALLVQLLVAFGNVIGRPAYYQVEASSHHANEFTVLVGRTSKARKGTSWDHVHSLMRAAEEQWAADHIATGLSSGQGLIWHVRDPIKTREKIKAQGKVRYEEVESDPGVADKRMLVVEPEFASVLRMTEQQANTLSAVLRQAFDGTNLRILNKNSPTKATGAHISLIGNITAEELRRYLTRTEMANGLGNRFLWVCTDRSKFLPEGGCMDVVVRDALQGELAQSLAAARSVGQMTRDDDARSIWCDVYGELSAAKPGLAGALLARAEAHVLRLSMLYALIDRSPTIQEPHLLAALAVWDYCERSVYYIFGDELGDPVADDLLRLLRTCPSGLTRTEIRDYFQRNASADRITRALGLLLQHKLARKEQQETGGRPCERWFALKRAAGRPP
jgi:hypothetical protein